MGAGKSTFARSFLAALGISRGGSGSPTFAIAHEYQSASGALVLHADFYRLRSEEELEETGINSALWERRALALLEWTSLFPEYQTQLIQTSAGRVFRVSLDFCENEQLRKVRIEDALAD